MWSMETIRERAYKKYPVFPDEEIELELTSPCRRAYIAACAEQRAIDIEKACEWLMKQYAEDDMDMVSASAFINDFRKAMEE